MGRIATLVMYSEQERESFEELVDLLKEKYHVEPLEGLSPEDKPMIYKISTKE